MDMPPGSEGASPPKTTLNGHIKPLNRRPPLAGTPREAKADDTGADVQAIPPMHLGTGRSDQQIKTTAHVSRIDSPPSNIEPDNDTEPFDDQIIVSQTNDNGSDPSTTALSSETTESPTEAVSLTQRIRNAVAKHLSADHAEELVKHEVSDSYDAMNPLLARAKAYAEAIAQILKVLQDKRDRVVEATKTTPLIRVSMPGPRERKLEPHDLIVLFFLIAGTLLGTATAWNTFARYVAESTVIGTLTDNYIGALLFSSLPVTAGLLFKVGGPLCGNAEEERAYYNRLFKWAVVATISGTIIFSLTFGPHQDDGADLLQTALNSNAGKTSFIDAVKSALPYAITASAVIAEALSAPLIFNWATQKHLAGRRLIVAKNDEQAYYEGEIEALGKQMMDIVEEKAANDALLAFHSSMKAAAVATAIDLLRQIQAERLQADKQFISKRFGGI